MIQSFRHKGLKELFETGRSGKVNAKQKDRALSILDLLEEATCPEDMNLPGLRFHPYTNKEPKVYSVDISGPWRILFKWSDDGPTEVDLAQPH